MTSIFKEITFKGLALCLFFCFSNLFFTNTASSQSYQLVNHNGETVETCSGSFSLGSYDVGTTYIMTVCSDDPIDKHVRVFIQSYSFPAGTELCVYDGPDENAPQLVCWNSSTTAGSVAAQATGSNESGCLTFVFTSTTGGASWSGNFFCEFVCQSPMLVEIVSSEPAMVTEGGVDYVNVCWDENNNQSFDVTFNAEGTYPNTAYPIEDANVMFRWDFNDGSPIVEGMGLTTVTHNFPERQGYTVTLSIEDSQGCQNTNAVTQRVRVSRAPIWDIQSSFTDPNEICMGETVEMCAEFGSAEWSSSIVPVIADTTHLPDGTGVCYETSITQTQFDPGQVLTDIDYLNGICMNLVHTYLADLTIYIECPNGQTVQLQAQSGGGANLGEPPPFIGEDPGVGYWYCITEEATQTMGEASPGWGGTLPAGDYASYQPLSGLEGCLLNGQWTITICDNWAIDEGYIFGWYIDFDESLFPEIWSYTPEYSPTEWSGLYGSIINPPIDELCATGTYITTGTPQVNSDQPFIFTLTDDFGCTHDTTMYVTVFHEADPNCCVLPDPDAGVDDEICSYSIQLNASDPLPENNAFWTMISGPGTATFTDETDPNATVTVNVFGVYEFQWTEQYLGNQACESSDIVTIEFLESYDPQLTDIDDMCISNGNILVEAIDYGDLVCVTAPTAISPDNIFSPEIAGAGNHTITNTIFDPCSGQDVTSTITFEVFDEIQLAYFYDTLCIPGSPHYMFEVEFEIHDYFGNPTSDYLINGSPASSAYFSEQLQSPGSYNYTITDHNGCNEIVINGYRDCVCPLYAGTMNTTQLQILCENQCSGELVSHNQDSVSDTGTVFEFMIHAGDNVPLAYNSTPDFCMFDFGAEFNTIYYISAIIGFDTNSNGHPEIEPPGCYSVSIGTPVMWRQNPIATTGMDKETCGLIVQLSGNQPEPEMYGYWTSSCDFFAIGGTSYTDYNATVMASDYNDCIFTWNIVNNQCTDSDDMLVRFIETPNAFAGSNQTVCGNCVDLSASQSIQGSTATWAGSGVQFSDPNSFSTTACVSTYGTHQFVVREINEMCFSDDDVLVTFIEEPTPTVLSSVDTVCGNSYNLKVFNVQGQGSWTAYKNGEPLSPAPVFVPNSESPFATASIGSFTDLTQEIEFIWSETNQSGGVVCEGSVTQTVVFARNPNASVGANDFAEVCGISYTFASDVTGSEWAVGNWMSTKVPSTFDDPSNPSATATMSAVPASFGDSAHVEVPYLWIVRNPEATSCFSMDTMTVLFYQRPVANAGLDNAVCGNNYQMGAVFNLPQSENYTPFGEWFVAERPVTQASADWSPNSVGDSVGVTVSHYGLWTFRFRENNQFLSSCYSTDTVLIEFVEVPIVDAGDDKHVCGQCTELEAISSPEFSGAWSSHLGNFDDLSDPNSQVCVNVFGGVDFIWTESNFAQNFSVSCSSRDTVNITFWRVPKAEILTDEADSTTCGLHFNNLRALALSTGLNGMWYNETDPDPVYGNVNSHNTYVTVSGYGYHDFYWIASNGPTYQPDFCIDTAGPLRIHFIERPNANAGGDTLFCGKSGNLSAIPSVGTGVWSTPSSELIGFDNENSPNALVTSEIYSSSSNPYFNLIWTEDNTNECTDRDTIKVRFGRIPNSAINIVPPKCAGEQAILSAQEDSLQQYDWNFSGGIIDTTNIGINPQGGNYEYFVHWFNEDTAHRVSLVVTNSWGCQSSITIDSVYEPPIPDFDLILVGDTCMLGKGGIVFQDTLGQSAFYWLNDDIGPPYNSPITAVYNLPVGEYDVRARYRTPNSHWSSVYNSVFGNDRCTDTIRYEIEPIGMLYAEFEVPVDVLYSELVAPNAEVWFNNSSDYGGVNRRCVWHFGDGNTLISCDEQVYHTYTEAGCFEPFLIVMNRDLQQCRDTAYIDFCIEIDRESKIEVPNVFTPDGDGINDYFQVKAQSIRQFHGYIVNRWGTVVYEWTNWEDEDAGWDGRLSGGTEASSGVYYYIINAIGMDDVEYELQGHLHLIR